LTLINGAAYAVYEVVDSNPLTLETAQFPTFLGLAANAVQSAVATAETVTYAPVSTQLIANATSPIPRFEALTPPSDCGVIGDCGAAYFPQLTVGTASLQFALAAGGPNQVQYVPVTNSGAGVLAWTASVSYTTGSGWLTVSPVSGINNGTINVYANPGGLAVGTYQATVTVDAASAGRRVVMVTLTVSVATNPGPQVVTVENGADFLQVPVVPGSIATILGTALTGTSVSASFNGAPATILYSSAQQINLVVPAGLTSSAQLVVAVNGQLSAPVNVAVAPFEPGIFSGAILNQDSTLNSVTNGAAAGSVIYFYATGLSGTGTISAIVGTTALTNLYYAGPAPGYPGVQQVNLVLPSGLGAGTVNLNVCGTSASGKVCSPPMPLVLK
jgi:uncharacterized protein (TIGR03437 family)